MLHLNVEAETFQELIQKAMAQLGVKITPVTPSEAFPTPVAPVPNPVPPEAITTTAPPAAAPKAKRGRPSKAQTAKEKLAPPPAPPAPPAPPLVTYDQMKAALQKVSYLRADDMGNAGIQRVTGILARYGVKKVKDLLPEHFADVLADCEKDLAG